MSRETKTLHLLIKATGITTNDAGQEFGQIEAYGAMFGNVDEGNDRIVKGAFTRTIQNSKARSKNRQTKYVLPMLWQHDTNELIGGWYDLKEDETGLLCKGEIALATQRGHEYYELAKAGMTDQFSIIYDVPTGGAKYDKSGVRDLTELRLFSIDPVTFAMNDETYLVGVKAKTMDKKEKPKEKKTLLEHYQEEMCQDLLEDWQDVYVCSLTSALLDAFTIGDQPAQDISQALDDFKTLVLEKFVTQAVECGLSDYLEQNTYSSTPADYTLQYGSESRPSYGGYMSRQKPLQGKAGRAISAANSDKIQSHVDAMHDIADKAMKMMKSVHSSADDLATVLQGSEAAYGDGEGTPDDGQQEGKASSRTRVPGTKQRSSDTDTAEREIALTLAGLKNLRVVR
jgi:Escherichia/Staphylococcus phage prohead protease